MDAVIVLLTLLMLASLGAAMVGLIKPPLVRASSRGKALGIYCGLAFAFMMTIGVIAPNPEKTDQEQVAEAKQEQVAEVKQEQTTAAQNKKEIKIVVDGKAKDKAKPQARQDSQANKDAVLAFEQRMFAIEKPSNVALDKMRATATRFDSRQASIHDLYAAIKNAHGHTKAAWQAAGDIHIAHSLPNDAKRQLRKAREQFQVSLYCKMNGLEAFMEYLDNHKPSYVQKYKSEMASAQSFTINAVATVYQVKDQVGLVPAAGDGTSQVQ